MWTEMVCSWCLGKVLINSQLVPFSDIYLFQLSFWQKDRRHMKLNSNYQVVPWSWGSISKWKELIISSWGPREFHEIQGILSATAWSPREYCSKREGHGYLRLFSQQIPILLLHIGLFKYNRENNLNNFAVKRVN